MDDKVLIHSDNINSKVLITDKKVKYIKNQNNYNRMNWKTNKQQLQQQTMKLIIWIDKSKYNIKQINR